MICVNLEEKWGRDDCGIASNVASFASCYEEVVEQTYGMRNAKTCRKSQMVSRNRVEAEKKKAGEIRDRARMNIPRSK